MLSLKSGDSRRWIIGLCILGVIGFIAFRAIPTTIHKSVRPPTRQDDALDECTSSVYKKYIKDKSALDESITIMPSNFSTSKVIAKRRLEENFCLDFIHCVIPITLINIDEKRDEEARKFDICLRGEMLEDYDAVLREDTDDDEGPTPDER
jgi:hypothetical protein